MQKTYKERNNSFQRTKKTEYLIIFYIALQEDVQKHLMKLQTSRTYVFWKT